MPESGPPAPPPAAPSISLLSLWFGFRAQVSRRAYLASGVGLMAFKYAVDAGVASLVTGKLFTPLDYLNPVLSLRSAALSGGPQEASPQGLLLAMAVFALPFLWIGVSMSMRRAIDAGLSPWLGLLFFVPGVNYLLMAALAALPSRVGTRWPLTDPSPVVDARLSSALAGVAVGTAIAVAMALLSIYVLGSYGAALFLGTPVVMGAASAWVFNQGHPRTMGASLLVALLSVGMAGLGLLLFALEGVVCLAMAFPIAAGLSLLGAVIGRSIALTTSSTPSQAYLAALVLPLLTGAEARWSEPLERSVTTVRTIDAPPEVVWRHVVTFSELPPPGEWFFNAGIAYPMRARIEGHGVGAVRRCEFSTGAFVEPITAWEEPQRLAFAVTAQPQAMKEWSPYRFVNAPHLERSFRSQRGEFRLISLDGGQRTRLEGTTWYTLDMAPALYWRLWSEGLLHAIHTRVLDHIARLAEADH